MTESTELENRPNTSRDHIDQNQPTTDENQPTEDDSANERRPLILTVDHRRRRRFITRAVLDHIYIACLSVVVVLGVGIGIYLLIVEGRRGSSEKELITARNSWYAQNNPLNMTKLVPPIKKVRLIQTATGKCWSNSECTELIRNIQNDHMKNLDEPDIIYNFMIGNDERIYEGRGWNYASSYKDDAEDAITVAFLGYYRNMAPTAQQVAALEELLDFGVYTDYLVPCYEITAEGFSSSPPRGIIHVADELQEKVKKLNKC